MPLRQDLLNPIAGDNPSGVDVRREIYGEIREARRQEDGLPQGDWQHERKVADFALVSRLTQENLATKSKDLQLAAWLAEAALHLEGFAGLHQGLEVCIGLITNFWDSLYPIIEDGDAEARVNLLGWLSTSLELPLKNIPLTRAGYGFLQYKESRLVGYEEHAQTDKEKETRVRLVAEGKLTPEAFDKAFAETPKAFYVKTESDLLACLSDVKALDALCDAKLGNDAPSFNTLRVTLEEIHHTVTALLHKKQELEPDPVETPAAASAGGSDALAAASSVPAAGGVGVVPSIVIPLASSETPERRDAVAQIALAAAHLRKLDPHSPAPYLLMRGLRWGELRASPDLSNVKLLEAPSTDLRQHIKGLAIGKKWSELLEDGENAMSLPCSRAWLDLQRLVVMACTALGPEYEPIAASIRSELRNLLNDLPTLIDANLLDDTPVANAETRAWLKELMQTPPAPSSEELAATDDVPAGDATAAPSWLRRATNPFALAQDAVRAGDAQKGFQIMQAEIARQRSGRGRFQRTLQLVQLCVEAGNEAIAQPLIDDLAAAIDEHKLDGWEDGKMVAAALATVMKVSKKMQDDPAENQKLFERICRLDPVRVLRTG